jgi:hypothetical protein
VPLNVNCRDEIVPILASLQHLYADEPARDELLTLIAKDVNATSDPCQGRPGLGYWEIVVLGAVRLGCDFDYDKLQNLAEEHRSLRRIMGIGTWDDYAQKPRQWDWRRIRDNVCLIQPETLLKINELVVRTGHQLEPTAPAKVRGDTFVVKTNIHYPTDANLLADGLRKILKLGAQLASLLGLAGWRQGDHLCKRLRRLLWASVCPKTAIFHNQPFPTRGLRALTGGCRSLFPHLVNVSGEIVFCSSGQTPDFTPQVDTATARISRQTLYRPLARS